ncbi:serine/threonine-protein kinase/endoribonuclease IRE1a-like protein, partial [Tanacetum coccineum]
RVLRIIVAHDTSVFGFYTTGDTADLTSSIVLYQPTKESRLKIHTAGQKVGANGFKRVDITAEEERKWNLKYTYFTRKYFKDARRVELSVGNLLENTQRIYHGTYDGMDCYMKRVHVTTMGYDHFHLKLLKSCNEQSNMLRIYDARCDGLHYEIAIEKCSMNLDEFIRRKTKDRRELLRMFREIIRGIIHIHDNVAPSA